MKQIINLEKHDHKDQPIFLGNDLGIQRYDSFKYPFFFNNYQSQLNFFWRPEEFDLRKDRNDFKNLADHEKFIFTSNLKYQILLDSVQARGIPQLMQYVSLPEVEAAFTSWMFFEQIHSRSYTHIIQNVYSDPTALLDEIYESNEIKKRALSVTSEYNKLINAKTNIKDRLYLTLISINILEGIRFYVSFACSFAFSESKKMEGNAKIIKYIARDEFVHLSLTQQLIKTLAKNESEGFLETIEKNKDIVIQMYKDTAEEEKEWANYLFQSGSILGLNADFLSQYMEHLTNKRMKSLGLEPLYGKVENPFEGWIEPYFSSKSVQVAPQETEVESYTVGAYDNDLAGMF